MILISVEMTSQSLLRRTERSNKGVNPQLFINSQNDEKLEKEAQGLEWVFYHKGDAYPFPVPYNSCRWPDGYTTAMKMNLKQGDKVHLAYNGGPLKCSLTCRVRKSEVTEAERVVASKLADADHTLTDVSYLPLVSVFGCIKLASIKFNKTLLIILAPLLSPNSFV